MRLLLFILLLFTAPAMAFEPCLIGVWYDPDRPAEVLFIETLAEDGATGTFYTLSGSPRMLSPNALRFTFAIVVDGRNAPRCLQERCTIELVYTRLTQPAPCAK